MHYKKEIENHYLNYIIFLLFIGIWGSLGSDPYDFLIIFDNPNNIELKINIINFLNLLRAIFPTLGLIICLGIIINYKIFYNHDRFIYILFFLQLLQLICTFLSQNSFLNDLESTLDHIGRYNWIISSITTLFIFLIANKLKYFDLKKLFYISIFFLTIMIVWFSFISIKDFYTLNVKTSLYNLDVYRESAYMFGHPIPRLTGLSRSIIFIYILILFIKFEEKNFLFFFRYFLLIILGSLLFLYQSKFALIIFLLIKLIFILKFKNKLKPAASICLLITFQILLFFGVSNSRTMQNEIVKGNYNSISTEIIKKEKEISHFRSFVHETKTGIDLLQQLFFSGRTTLWQDSLKLFFNRPIVGYGSMWDRIVLNKTRLDKTISYNPVSNAFIYSLISGGLFSLALFIYFWINIKQRVFEIFKFNLNQNYNVKVGSLIITVIFLRCMVENSIMLFGIDYIILLNSLYLFKEK